MVVSTPRDTASVASSHSGAGRTYPSRKFKSPAGGNFGTPVPPQLGGPSPAKQTSPQTVQHKHRKHLNLAAVQSALSENEDGVDSMRREIGEYQEVRRSSFGTREGWIFWVSVPSLCYSFALAHNVRHILPFRPVSPSPLSPQPSTSTLP